jgi:hypothetical protein
MEAITPPKYKRKIRFIMKNMVDEFHLCIEAKKFAKQNRPMDAAWASASLAALEAALAKLDPNTLTELKTVVEAEAEGGAL